MPHPVVLIHGMWCTGTHLERVAAGLKMRGFKCVLAELPAHAAGVAHPEVGALGLRDYAGHLKQFIAAQNFAQPPVLLGHSMGGLLAQMLAAEIEVFALVLLTPASPAGINALGLDTTAAFARTLARPGFWKRPHRPTLERARRSVLNGIPRAQQEALYRTFVDESGRALSEIAFWWADGARASRVDATQVRCPVYVVSAGRDRLVPAGVVRKVAARYPGAALRHYPERGHMVIADDETDEMMGEIAGWLLPFEQRAAKGMPLR